MTSSWKILTSAALVLAAVAACGGTKDSDRTTGGDGDGNGDGDPDGLGGGGAGSGDGDGDTGDGDSGNGASSGDGDGDGDGDGIGKACATTDQNARLTQANLLFVVDRSGSMNCNAPEYTTELSPDEAACIKPEKQVPGSPSKWEETQAAISGALESLIGAENVNVGLTVFPKPDDIEQCLVSDSPDVDIKRLTTDHKSDIDEFLAAVAPQGETPIAGASMLSYKYLSEQLVAGDLKGNTFVVLFTDGQETCDVDDMGTPTAVSTNFIDHKVADATKFNIRTFVIGAPGSEGARAPLSEIAFQGLTASDDSCAHSTTGTTVGDCHFDMTESTDFVGDLSAALSKITNDKALSCVYDVPQGTAVDLSKVNVTFTPADGEPVDIFRDDSEECGDGAQGWQYTDDFTKITLCGDICDEVQAQDGVVRIVLGCPTLVTVVK